MSLQRSGRRKGYDALRSPMTSSTPCQGRLDGVTEIVRRLDAATERFAY
jgi:hypothetical protein